MRLGELLGEIVCGIDEAGRGPLAGPVCAAAVILDSKSPIEGVRDSKQLTSKNRDELAPLIRERARAWAIGWADVEEIDQLNIRQANLLAMSRAYSGLSVRPSRALVDGDDPPNLGCQVTCIVGGDVTIAAISAASILAKTARDALMLQLDEWYPGYGFAKHKGYGVPEHLDALRRLGPCPAHRKSWRPVREAMEQHAPAMRRAAG